MKKLWLFLLVLPLFFPPVAQARVGVGVGVGKIRVEQILKPGMIYELPLLTVLNTGDEPAEYSVMVTYHQDQKELPPPKEWFSFSPSTFPLKPGGVQTVTIRINLPLKTPPGEYFAYLEGYPIKKNEAGKTAVGIAAAAKLYFKVAPANLVLGIYYRAASFWRTYQPWTNRALIALAPIAGFVVFNRFFKIQIKAEKKPLEEPNER
jgi:hypothetical protein